MDSTQQLTIGRTMRLLPTTETFALLVSAERENSQPVNHPRAEDRLGHRQIVLLMEWRVALERAGYHTLLSLVPPMALIVSDPRLEERWIVVSPSGLLIVRELEACGRTWSRFHLLQRAEGDVDGPNSAIALAAAREHIGRWIGAPSDDRLCDARADGERPCDGVMLDGVML